MSFESLKMNIEREKKIIREIYGFLNHAETISALEVNKQQISADEKKLLKNSVDSLISQLRTINNSLPEIINNISFFKELPGKETVVKKNKKLMNVEYQEGESPVSVTINKKEKEKFLKSLTIGRSSVEKLKKGYAVEKAEIEEFKKPSKYAKISNKFFKNLAKKSTDRGYFASLNKALRKISSPFIINTYVAMIFFSMLIGLLAGVLLFILSLFFSFSFAFPFLSIAEGSLLIRFLKNLWLLVLFPVIVFGLFYYYPFSEQKAIDRKINQELPFVVIYMAAIATSKIEPTKIFQIIVSSRDYPYTNKEIKKLINQINFYGYDLSTALKNSARGSPSRKLAELFSGLATAISSGSELGNFLEKHADSLLFDYRLEREKYTKTAETFMNIYISIIIAAPMILMILFVMINMTGMSFYGLSTGMITFLLIFGIAILNVVFLVILQIKQPGY